MVVDVAGMELGGAAAVVLAVSGHGISGNSPGVRRRPRFDHRAGWRDSPQRNRKGLDLHSASQSAGSTALPRTGIRHGRTEPHRRTAERRAVPTTCGRGQLRPWLGRRSPVLGGSYCDPPNIRSAPRTGAPIEVRPRRAEALVRSTRGAIRLAPVGSRAIRTAPTEQHQPNGTEARHRTNRRAAGCCRCSGAQSIRRRPPPISTACRAWPRSYELPRAHDERAAA